MSVAFVDRPDDIKCTLQFSMSLKDWKQVRKTLQSNTAYTEIQVINEINDLVHKMEQTFYSSLE